MCIEFQIMPIEIFTYSILVARILANPTEYHELLPDDLCNIFERSRDGLLLQVPHACRLANRVARALACFLLL